MTERNVDRRTVEGFGVEWQKFDQTTLPNEELDSVFAKYFRVFPWQALSAESVGFDMGCGSGRWARRVAPHVKTLHCIDASAAAIEVARRALADQSNCILHHASVDDRVLPPGSMDFGYSLGVLHHVPDPAGAIRECVRMLKPGAPLLLYLYYALENRSVWFRNLWRLSDLFRRLVFRLPPKVRPVVADTIARLVYWPLARAAGWAEKRGRNVSGWPLAQYRTLSFYTMRTDALDRFGTRLEHRFTAQEVKQLLSDAGLEGITLSDNTPYWCAVGYCPSPAQ